MNQLIELILDGDYNAANEIVSKQLFATASIKLEEKKHDVMMGMLDEKIQNVRKVGRIKIIRIRIRKGKVQRRKKMSAVKGFVLRGGRVQRMKPIEKLRRKRGARRAKVKRRSKQARILRKRRISLRKRHNLGL